MDLREYFTKIKETETSLEDQYPLIVSLKTADGGKAGAMVEVSRLEAAKALVDGRAVLATDDQKKTYQLQEAAKKKLVEKAELSKRLQIAIVSDTELRNITPKQEKEEEPKGSR